MGKRGPVGISQSSPLILIFVLTSNGVCYERPQILVFLYLLYKFPTLKLSFLEWVPCFFMTPKIVLKKSNSQLLWLNCLETPLMKIFIL